jgi:hypothetical protein
MLNGCQTNLIFHFESFNCLYIDSKSYKVKLKRSDCRCILLITQATNKLSSRVSLSAPQLHICDARNSERDHVSGRPGPKKSEDDDSLAYYTTPRLQRRLSCTVNKQKRSSVLLCSSSQTRSNHPSNLRSIAILSETNDIDTCGSKCFSIP